MMRTALFKTARPLATARWISTTPRMMGAGDTGSGSGRPTGSRGGDAFTRRETAAEELFIREEEKTKLRAIQEKLKQQKAHIEELSKHIDEMTKEDGGQGEQPIDKKP